MAALPRYGKSYEHIDKRVRGGWVMSAPRESLPSPQSIRVVQGVFARTFKSLTWRRFGIFCLLVVVMASASSLPHDLVQGKSAAVVAQHVLIKLGAFMTIYLPVLLAVIAVDNWAPKDTYHRVAALIAAVLLGGIVGSLLSYGAHLFLDPKQLFDPEVYSGAMTLRERVGGWVEKSFLAALATTVYFLVVREDEAHTALHREKMDRLSLEREMTEAQLQVMQAQIEPHFLFNTLANVRRLYQTDAPMGRAMLQHLSRYLSAALPQMREAQSTLGRELSLTVAYLNVQKIRMGPRLRFEVDVPDELKGCAVPPMMLLTLAENAIRHGLVPLPKGGSVQVSARVVDGTLRLQVADTGRGLQESSGVGVGLANIRARLKTLYETGARLLLAQSPASGVVATLELPVVVSSPETADA